MNYDDLVKLVEDYPQEDPAWSLLDAFDAVTNGMENPESFEALGKIKEPHLQPWKHLTFAIQALYNRDIRGCRRSLKGIPPDSAPGALLPFFQAWFTEVEAKSPGKAPLNIGLPKGPAAELYRLLRIAPHPLSLLAREAEEALIQGMDEHFTAQSCRALKILQAAPGIPSALAIRYARFCLELLFANRRNPREGETMTLRWLHEEAPGFVQGMLRQLGDADGRCVMALALLESDEEGAAACFREALAAGDGRFLDASMADLVAEILPILQQPRRRGRPPRLVKSEQLDLFENLA